MRPIFIGGCPRSGTTLLAGLLGGHPECLAIPEMQFKFPLMRRVDVASGTIPPEDVLVELRGNWRFGIWDIDIDPDGFRNAWREDRDARDGVERLTFAQAVRGVVRCFAADARAAEPAVWVDHTPDNIRYAHRLLEHFRDATMIHIVRDGRGVAASVIPLDWGPNTAWSTAHWWPEWLAFGLAAEQAHPTRVIRVHFEHLLRDPRSVLSEVCEVAGLEVPEHLGTRTEIRLPSYTHSQHRLVSRAPDASRADAWRRSLPPRHVEMFESYAGDLLRTLGYDLEFGDSARRRTRPEKASTQMTELLRAGTNHVRHSLRVRGALRNSGRGGPRAESAPAATAHARRDP